MSHKENIAPLSSARRKENSLEILKGEKLTLSKNTTNKVNVSQQKHLVSKENIKIHTDAVKKEDSGSKKNNVDEKSQVITRSKADFLRANSTIPATPSKAPKATPTQIDKPIVFNDHVDDKKPIPKSEERPMLLPRDKEEQVQIHHKPLKALQTPVIDVEQKEIDKLQNELEEQEQLKEAKSKELSQLQELLKVYKEREEQLKMLEEAEEMITAIYESFDESFNTTLMSYTMRLALKEEQHELLLNELSELNYRLSEQEED